MTKPLRRLRRHAKRIWSGIQPRAVVLVYHRVFDAAADPMLLSVTPRHFEEHLEVIKQDFAPTSLCDLPALMQGGRSLHRSVVVTFDDGYADNLDLGKPSLVKHDVPATVFISSGYLGEPREYWWDDLERILLEPDVFPEKLSVALNGQTETYELGDQGDAGVAPGWNVLDDGATSPRHEVYRELVRRLKPMPDPARRQTLGELARAVGLTDEGRPTHRALTAEGVRELADGGLVEIGAHTVTHPQLSAQALDDQRWEIGESRRALEGIIEGPVESFAYPFGGRSDYAEDTVDVVRDAGFRQACANWKGCVTARSDRFELPRFLVRDWDGDEFTRRLREMFAGA